MFLVLGAGRLHDADVQLVGSVTNNSIVCRFCVVSYQVHQINVYQPLYHAIKG